ncbi:SIR2 family protein [Marispirochaeta aestuarii]|uniref:SIR2 family protein n=1 Tax=Marispirochaeta aestuarii TaxID=1963862 RepID=UPI002ABE39BD|nr:SIR2 family protein [Marispirochaeta aestuarii]
MKPESVKRIVDNRENDLAFIIGNGINRYYGTSKSWEDILLELWKKFSYNTLGFRPNGISLTEIYDLLDLQNLNDNIENNIQKEVKRIYLNVKPNIEQNKLLERIKINDSQILTTNYDDLMCKSMGLTFYNPIGNELTDYYPWECYYSNRKLETPLDGFGIWHMNGMIKYHRSIKLGLQQYMGNIYRARKWIHGNYEDLKFTEKNQKTWPGMNSWLHILFNKSLCIIGLGLEENEIFIRWLLIERAKYYRRFPERKKQGWYIKLKNEVNDGKDFLLEGLGFQVIEMKEYSDIYEKIWE